MAEPRKPQDHKKPAAQQEAELIEVVDVEYKGETYVFPASLEEADGDVVDAIDEMKLSRALRGLLEPTQWADFKKTRPRVKDYAGLFNAYAETIGLDGLGE